MKFALLRRLVRYRIVVTLLFYVLLAARLYMKYAIDSPDKYGILSGFVLLSLFCCWAVILMDMILNKIQDKVFWIIFMFPLAYVTPLVYLFQRKEVENSKFNDFCANLKAKFSRRKSKSSQ